MTGNVPAHISDVRIYHWVKSCLSKVRYVSEKRARLGIARSKRRGKFALYSYLCPHCAGWHLTKRPQQ